MGFHLKEMPKWSNVDTERKAVARAGRQGQGELVDVHGCKVCYIS